MNLYREVKRRKVPRVAVVYAATAFVVLQAADLLASGLGLPEWVFRAITLLVIVGFPIALVLAWALEVTPDGIRRTPAAEPEGTPAPSHDLNWDWQVATERAAARVAAVTDRLAAHLSRSGAGAP